MAYVDQGEWNKARVSLQRALQLKKDFDGAADAQKALTVIGACAAPTR